MKIIEAIKRVDKSNTAYINARDILEALELNTSYYPDLDQSRLRSYPVCNWYCTDTRVGLNAIYFGNEPAGLSWQNARKSYVEFKWLSEEIALEIRNYIKSLIEEEEQFKPYLIMDDDTIDEYFSVMSEQRLSGEGYYEGVPARALIWYTTTRQTTPMDFRRGDRAYFVNVPRSSDKYNKVLIFQDGVEKLVSIEDFKQRINVVD